ncbi:MAG TPA: aminotransferase class V-fold PLP-dependent enzyme [Coriobacteriia bacterium]|nr:aminotransferase class V-fold PLP-dependent enzyme [Coriobacteriia bacterium]
MADAGGSPTAIYLDHGATSWPKPPEVVDAVTRSLTEFGGNPGRGAYRLALDTARAIHSARADIAHYFGVEDSRNLIFQPGCTQAMNLVLMGLFKPGDRIVAGGTEHNAVARPLNLLASRGVEVILVEPDEDGVVDPDEVEAAVEAAPTAAIVCQHASNLAGGIHPVADLSDIAHSHGALMIVDGAQAGGHLRVNLAELGVDVWACAGHKGLLGPQGIGVLYLAPGCEPAELVSGGTGSGQSEEPLQPKGRPDRYEAGTPNTPGILGLGAAVNWLGTHGDELRAEEARLTRMMHEGLLEIEGFRVLGPESEVPRVPIVSAVHDSVEVDRIAFALDRRYGIATRGGLHCAPWAHRASGTLETGALRFGIGYGNTVADIERTLEAVAQIVAEER